MDWLVLRCNWNGSHNETLRNHLVKNTELAPTIDFPSLFKIDASILLDEFLTGNENTIEAYRQDLADFSKYLNCESIDVVSKAFIQLEPAQANLVVARYKQSLIERELAPKTINRRLSAIKSLLKEAKFLGLVQWDLQVKFLKVTSYKDTRGTSVDNLRKMMQLAKSSKNKIKAKRDFCMLRLMADLALRRKEVVQLTIADVDFDNSRISILGKGRNEKEFLSLPLATQLSIKEWIDVRGDSEGALICSMDRKNHGESKHMTGKAVYKIISGYGKKLGIKARPHGIRHTSITKAMQVAQENGIGLEKVMKFSRHKNLNTIMVYRDNLEDAQGEISNLVADVI